MIKRVKLKAEHLIEVLNEPGVRESQDIFNDINESHDVHLEKEKDCYALIDAYGRVLACCGIHTFWKNRAEAWTLFRPNLGSYLVAVFRHIRKFLMEYPCERIESYISYSFEKGDQWMSALGFHSECGMLHKYRNGKDYSLYVMIKEGVWAQVDR